MSTGTRLEYGLGDGNGQQIVFARLDDIELIDEQRECSLDAGIDNDALANRLDS
jgi:hypothetical protein